MRYLIHFLSAMAKIHNSLQFIVEKDPCKQQDECILCAPM